MGESRTSLTAPAVVVILLALLVAAYVGCYFATVQRDPLWSVTTGGQLVPAGVAPYYRGIHSKTTADLFWPIHWVDCRVRSSYWDDSV